MAEGGEIMQLSAVGLELLKRSEGFRSHVYLDVEGLPTIGYGHRLVHPESFPKGIGEAQADRILAGDIREAEQAVERLVRVALTQGQFDALVDFCFNLGAGKLAASTLLKELNAERYNAAGEQLLRWDHAGAEVNIGLKARREAEFQLWCGAGAGQEVAA
ncbi:MAG: lysozyme [Acidobacteriota bacterium]|nr:lysozyme [Acidobacteriota bacterium]